MLNCCHYNTSEVVMILYYNAIDPVEGLTPLSVAEEINRPSRGSVLRNKLMLLRLYCKSQ